MIRIVLAALLALGFAFYFLSQRLIRAGKIQLKARSRCLLAVSAVAIYGFLSWTYLESLDSILAPAPDPVYFKRTPHYKKAEDLPRADMMVTIAVYHRGMPLDAQQWRVPVERIDEGHWRLIEPLESSFSMRGGVSGLVSLSGEIVPYNEFSFSRDYYGTRGRWMIEIDSPGGTFVVDRPRARIWGAISEGPAPVYGDMIVENIATWGDPRFWRMWGTYHPSVDDGYFRTTIPELHPHPPSYHCCFGVGMIDPEKPLLSDEDRRFGAWSSYQYIEEDIDQIRTRLPEALLLVAALCLTFAAPYRQLLPAYAAGLAISALVLLSLEQTAIRRTSDYLAANPKMKVTIDPILERPLISWEQFLRVLRVH